MQIILRFFCFFRVFLIYSYKKKEPILAKLTLFS